MLKFTLFLIEFIIIFIKNEEDINKYNLFNPIAYTLLNENIIVFSNIGFLTFDSNFKLLYNNSFDEELKTMPDYIQLKAYYPSFLQIPEEEGGYAIILFLKNIYFFDKNEILLKIIHIEDFPDFDDSFASNYEMNYYKEENSEYFYTIIVYYYTTSNFDDKIINFYYKINADGNNILLNNKTYKNEDEVLALGFSITCQKLIANDSYKYITCFYQFNKENKYKISEISFKPDDDLNYLEERKYFEITDESHFFYNSVSTTNGDGSKAYVCYSSYDNSASCFYFDINLRQFSNIYIFGKNCKNDLFSLNIKYFSIKNEFVFSCVNKGGNGFYISKFEENMNLIRPSNYGYFIKLEDNCKEAKTCSIIYTSKSNEYFLFTYDKCYIETND